MPNIYQPKKEFMLAAIKQALKSKEDGDYAIGAVIVKDDKIIVEAKNRIKLDNDSTLHSEMVAIREASEFLKSRYLNDCILYTTHEPCPMCASAAVWARMAGIVYGSTLQDMIDYRKRNGNGNWTWRTIDITAKEVVEKGEPKLFIIEEFMKEECINLFHS